MQNVRLNIFMSKSDVFSYTIDISALLVYHTDFYSFAVFCTFALLYSGTENKYLLESIMKISETLNMLKS